MLWCPACNSGCGGGGGNASSGRGGYCKSCQQVLKWKCQWCDVIKSRRHGKKHEDRCKERKTRQEDGEEDGGHSSSDSTKLNGNSPLRRGGVGRNIPDRADDWTAAKGDTLIQTVTECSSSLSGATPSGLVDRATKVLLSLTSAAREAHIAFVTRLDVSKAELNLIFDELDGVDEAWKAEYRKRLNDGLSTEKRKWSQTFHRSVTAITKLEKDLLSSAVLNALPVGLENLAGLGQSKDSSLLSDAALQEHISEFDGDATSVLPTEVEVTSPTTTGGSVEMSLTPTTTGASVQMSLTPCKRKRGADLMPAPVEHSTSSSDAMDADLPTNS